MSANPMTPSLAAPSPGGTLQSLTALIERVEAGGPTSLGFWREIFRPALGSPDTTLFLNFIAAVRDGSLDAAVAFTEALLPEALWSVTGMHPLDPCHGPHASLSGYFGPEGPEGRSFDHVDTQAPTPALALVLATLRAHAAKETI